MYTVKTRNWHCQQWVKSCLDLSHKWGVVRGDSYEDGDGKYILSTRGHLKAWLTFLYFMAFRHFSGGWTYIVLPGHSLRPGNKAIN